MLAVKNGLIQCDDIGLQATVFNRDGSSAIARIAWSDATTAVAFKRDFFTIDMLCIALGTSAGAIEVNETQRSGFLIANQNYCLDRTGIGTAAPYTTLGFRGNPVDDLLPSQSASRCCALAQQS